MAILLPAWLITLLTSLIVCLQANKEKKKAAAAWAGGL